jgi:hypothetical protein
MLRIYKKTDATGQSNNVVMDDSNAKDPAFTWDEITVFHAPGLGHNISHEEVTVIRGTKEQSEPMVLSELSNSFVVKCEGPNVWVGCNKYDREFLRRELTAVCKNAALNSKLLKPSEGRVFHGKHSVTREDLNKLLAYLEELT